MNKIPQHVAIIMDGNGRWGLKHKKSRILGHKFGVNRIHSIIKFCIKKKIKILTLYTFSIDNWKRSKHEINNLFSLFIKFYNKNFEDFINKKIKLKIFGENKLLPKKILKIKKKINNTSINDNIIKVNIALNYSSKLEIISAFKKSKIFKIENIQKNLYLYPDPDQEILIRTGNVNRLSDFLLWQSAYSEIYFSKKLWPDFKSADLHLILKKYTQTKRNFGKA